MKTLKIYWRKDLKNSVAFSVLINGRECGMIKRGEVIAVCIPDDNIELYFVPNVPKFFGWKALKINAQAYGANPELFLSVELLASNTVLEGNQLRSVAWEGLNIIKSEHIKKYR